MLHLGGRVSAEVTDAGGPVIHGPCQLPCTHDRPAGGGEVPVVPVLAGEAVEGTGPVEDRQVGIAALRAPGIGIPGITSPASTRADIDGDTVRGKGIGIPLEDAPVRRPGQMDEGSTLIRTEAAVAKPSRWDPAPVPAERTGNTVGGLRRNRREPEGSPHPPVSFHGEGQGFFRPCPDAFPADPEGTGDPVRLVAAEPAAGCTRASSSCQKRAPPTLFAVPVPSRPIPVCRSGEVGSLLKPKGYPHNPGGLMMVLPVTMDLLSIPSPPPSAS